MGWACSARRPSTRCRRMSRMIWPRYSRISFAAIKWRGLKYSSVSTRSARRPGWRKHGNIWAPSDPFSRGVYSARKRAHNFMDFVVSYLHEAKQIIDRLDRTAIGRMLDLLEQTRAQGGRLFILGVGGSAANASHAVNDFRKLAGFEAYAPTDNVSELTARANDDGWPTVFVEWLRGSRLNDKDAVMVLSVGGGSLEKNVSPN